MPTTYWKPHPLGWGDLNSLDYGDEWYFRVELIGIEPVDNLKSYAKVMKSVGEAIPHYENPDDDDSDEDDSGDDE
ncbi:MAG: hypothetical protein Q7V05_16740 [Methanoregula sp.]|nr:hypothetical protein [Methanoregula sp.]